MKIKMDKFQSKSFVIKVLNLKIKLNKIYQMYVKNLRISVVLILINRRTETKLKIIILININHFQRI